MKKIILFVSLFVIIGVIGTLFFINDQDTSQITKKDSVTLPEVKEQKVVEETKSDDDLAEEIIVEDESKLPEESTITKDIPKTGSKIEESKPKQEIVEGTKTPVIEEKPKQQTAWEELGITEYDYYNKPMWSWARIDFKVSDYASAEETINACRSYGHKIMDEQGLGFSCSSINSYSGDYLGEMLKTF